MWLDILQVFIGILIGVVIGFFIAKKVMTNYLKKNPPINEEMIKALIIHMWRKPSQNQINQIMKSKEKNM